MSEPSRKYWLRVALAACVAAAVTASADAGVGIGSGVQGDGLAPGASFSAMTLSNTLLAASTALYLANLAFRAQRVGRIAALLAATGAFGIAGALAMRGVELGSLQTLSSPRRSYLYEATALFAAVSVFIYLAMESAFRDRSAGAFVMPVIMAAVACEMWLVWIGPIAAEAGLAGAGRYWEQSWAFAAAISEAALFVAAAGGVLQLLRAGLESRARTSTLAARVLPSGWRAFDVIVTAVAVGFPLYVLAGLIGAAAQWSGVRDFSIGSLVAGLAALAAYAWYFDLVYRGRGTGTRIAVSAIIGCAASVLAVGGSGLFGVIAVLASGTNA